MAIAGRPHADATDGLTDAAQAKLVENVVAGLTYDKLYRDSFLSRICNTEALKPLEKFGDTITFRVLKPGTVNPYTVNEDIVPSTASGDNFSVSVDRAFYTFQTLDAVDIKQINLPLMQKLSDRLAADLAEKEYTEVIAGIITSIYGATIMSAYGEQVPGRIYYKPSTPAAAATTTRTDATYLIKQFLAARKAGNKLGIPKKGRYALVNSDVEEILINCDQFTYNISGSQNAKAIEEGDFGLRIAGFDIIVTDEIPTAATFDSQTNIAKCVLGHQDGLGFIRQITESDINFKMERRFGRGCRQLEVFGFGFNDTRLFGSFPIKVA